MLISFDFQLKVPKLLKGCLGLFLMFIKTDALLISLKVSILNHCLQQDFLLVWEPIRNVSKSRTSTSYIDPSFLKIIQRLTSLWQH